MERLCVQLACRTSDRSRCAAASISAQLILFTLAPFQPMTAAGFTKLEGGLLYKDGKPGKGRTPEKGDRVVVEWTGARAGLVHARSSHSADY